MAFKWLHKLNASIRTNCEQKRLHLRPAGHGLWLCMLIPIALVCNVKNFSQFSVLYKCVSIVGVGQLSSSIFCILNYGTNSAVHYIPFTATGYICSSTVVSLLLALLVEQSIFYTLSIAISTSICFPLIFERIIELCPKCFTFGEAIMASQSINLFVASFCTNLMLSYRSKVVKCEKIATFVLQAGFCVVFIVTYLAFKYPNSMRNVIVFSFVLASTFVTFVVALPKLVIYKDSLLWILNLVSSRFSVSLLLVWSGCCLLAVACLVIQTYQKKPATSVFRKSFHILIFIVFLSGLRTHPCLMYVASGVGFAVLVTVEMARVLKLSHVYKFLDACFHTFKDDKDELLALTPLYLMVGCATPIWIYPFSFSKFVPVPVLAGVLTIAVGDSAASICGNWFGRFKWPQSSKTLEGTIACFLSQILTLVAFNHLGYLSRLSISRSAIVIGITSLVEARTDQIDNIVLPFLAYILFSII